MANGFYANGLKEFLDGDIDLATDTIKAALIDTGTYTVDLANHDFYDDLSGVVGTDATLGTKTTAAGGVFDAADTTFSSVSGNTVEAIVIYKDTGVAGTSALICYIDTGTGFPFTPNGSDVIVQWNASGIFDIG
jgi:hypothetical protein